MKYLLVTTINKNPGDGFIRIGVQNLLKRVDPGATFDLLDKEDRRTWAPRSFDLAIWCGMPMFWDEPHSHTAGIDWWELIENSWVTADRTRAIAVGIGHCFGEKIHDFPRYTRAIDTVLRRFSFVSTRSPVVCHPDIFVGACPALAAVGLGDPAKAQTKLANLIPTGGPYPGMHPTAVKAWARYVGPLADRLRAEGFKAVAHDPADRKEAVHRGWAPEEIIGPYQTPEEYLPVYRGARVFVGNRVHGAIGAIGAGAIGNCFGTDSRVQAVVVAGGNGGLAHEMSVDSIQFSRTPEQTEAAEVGRRTKIARLEGALEFVLSERF